MFLFSLNTYTTPPLVRAAALINRRCISSTKASSITERIVNYLLSGEEERRDYRQLYHFDCNRCLDSNKCPALQAAKVASIDQFSVDRHISEIKDFKRRQRLYWVTPGTFLLIPVMLGGCLFGVSIDYPCGLIISTVLSATVCTSIFIMLRSSGKYNINNHALVNSCDNIYYKVNNQNYEMNNKNRILILSALESDNKKLSPGNNTKAIAGVNRAYSEAELRALFK